MGFKTYSPLFYSKMTQTENICTELVTQGLKNISKQVYDKQFYEKGDFRIVQLNDIESFINRLAVVEPRATFINGEEMFRVTDIVGREDDITYDHMNLSKLREKGIHIFMDKKADYHIFFNKKENYMMTTHCPPKSHSIALAIWTIVWGISPNKYLREYINFSETIKKHVKG